MKNISKYIILAFGLIVSGCRDAENHTVQDQPESAVRLAVSLPHATRTADDDSYDALNFSTLRIYKIDKSAEEGDTERLIRKYSPVSEVPSEIYLAAGEYKVTVNAGDESKASFSHKSYYGEETFTLKPHDVSELSVVCKIKNIAVEILFDETVCKTFENGAKVYVNAADEFSKEDAENNQIPTLVYTENGIGYFLLPEGTENISWGFYGDTDDPDVARKSTKTGIIEAPENGMLYTLRFKYTHDAEGELVVSVQKRDYEEIVEDHFNFSPQPVIKGNGFDISDPIGYVSEPVVFTIDVINALSDITLTSSANTYTILADGQIDENLSTYGISCEISENGSATITLNDTFFAEYPAGINAFEISVADQNNAEARATAYIAIEGPLGIISGDLWSGEATLGAVITNPDHGNLTIKYKHIGEDEWHETNALVAGFEKYVYTAASTDFRADATYQFRLSENGTETGTILSQSTERGVQLPNAGFEEWHKSDKSWYPYAAGGEEFWGTGNPGATTMGENYNVTESVNDPRPDSEGTISAKLTTKYPSAFGIGKLAAGTLFVGAFGEISGTSGTVKMGRRFDFNARPKAMKVWYKYTPVKNDKGRIYICLVNMTKGDEYHIVDTSTKNVDKTTFSPQDEFLYSDKTDKSTLQGHIIGYGDFMIEETVEEWQELTLEITYREQYLDEKPNVLILTAASSYRGDYFEGEVGSTLYVDDIEFVY